MKRNLFLSLWLMIAAMLFIVSCKSELLEDDNQSVKSKQNLMVKQLRYDELKKQSPAIVEKISKFQKQNLAEVNSRIYHDTEEGFSVDTEKSLYIEDGEGNKTYTFKIERAESNTTILENLVLKDIGNSEFEAYIYMYDNVAVQNYANLSLEEIKSHVTITPIGKVNGSDIFGRMNANSCQITAISNMYDVYVPGTTCASYLHHTYSQLVECQHDVKPTSGYYNTITEYTTYDSCQSGGSTTGNGNGTVNTGPYSPQGNGSSYDDLFPSPCVKLKNLLNPSKANIKPLITGGMYSYINNSSKGEAGIYLKKDAAGNITSEIAPYTDKKELPIKSSGLYYSAIHTHPKTAYPMFSWTDIYNLYLLEMNAAVPFNRGHSSFLLVCEDNNGVMQTYAIVFEDIGSMMEDVLNNPIYAGCTPEEICREMGKKIEKEYNTEQDKNSPNYERVFLQFNFGTNIGLYKANSDLTNWSKLSINENSDTAIVNSVNCN